MNEVQKKEHVKKIWLECFADDPRWVDSYFDRVYNDMDARIVDAAGVPVSSLLLLPYEMYYQGGTLPIGYISGAATLPRYRRHGYMSELIKDTLRYAYKRGECMVCVKPASHELYFYYDKFDFSTVFYIREARYTSLHSFHYSGSTHVIENVDVQTLYDFFSTNERKEGRVLHSRTDFENILWDNGMDGGFVLAIGNNDVLSALAIGVIDDKELVIRDIQATDEVATMDMCYFLKKKYPDKDIVIEYRIEGDEKPEESRGMVRVTNVFRLLESMAKENPHIRQVIKISDDIIEENNHIFIINGGEVTIDDGYRGHVNTEMNIKTMAEVLFSSPATGKLFGLTSVRPSMSLMLE